MRHQDLTINHVLESWVYANSAARISAVGFIAGDIGRIAYQSDTGQYWRLTAAGPPSAWARIGVSPFASLIGAIFTPAGTTSTTGVMMGMSGILTPAVTGKVLISICGTQKHDTLAQQCQVSIRWGVGSTGPVNGAAATGTPVGSVSSFQPAAVPSSRAGFGITGLVTGLTIGQAIWIDALLTSPLGTGIASINNSWITAVELP